MQTGKEMIDYAKSMGAKGITVSGVCCTSNEVCNASRYSGWLVTFTAGTLVSTGACEAIVADVQYFPALDSSKCLTYKIHHKSLQ